MATSGVFDFYTACPGNVNNKEAVIVIVTIDGVNTTFSIHPDNARRLADDILRAANHIDPLPEEEQL